MRVRAAVMALVVTLSWVPDTHGLRLYVDGNAGAGGDDRRSLGAAQNPATPYRTITHALEVAHRIAEGRPHVIRIAGGTYSPSRGESFPLVITVPDIFFEYDPLVETEFDAEGASGILRILAQTEDFVIQGVEFRNGVADRGGAIYGVGASLQLLDCEFFDNRASDGGQVAYIEDGELILYNNLLRDNGLPGDTAPLIELHNVVGDAEDGDDIRNNTFFANPPPAILTSGNKTRINSNLFVETGTPIIRDQSPDSDPYLTYNLFWETDIFYISSEADSIKLARTVRDTTVTITVHEQPQPPPPPTVPGFLLADPDTIAIADQTYRYLLEVESNREFYRFIPVALPAGASQDSAEAGLIRWTPALADTGRYPVTIRIFNPFGLQDSLDYILHVFGTFPDTTTPPPIPPDTVVVVTTELVPDTTGAVAALARIAPAFAGGVSAVGNQYADPLMIDASLGSYGFNAGSPARDGGDPDPTLADGTGNPNDIGHRGGPRNQPDEFNAGTFADILITNLPDSVAVEGQEYVYDPVVPETDVFIVSAVEGPPTMAQAFSKAPPIVWTPTIADTGSYFVNIELFNLIGRRGRQLYSLRVKPANERPVVTSSPVLQAFEDEPYRYQVEASDANEDSLSPFPS